MRNLQYCEFRRLNHFLRKVHGHMVPCQHEKTTLSLLLGLNKEQKNKKARKRCVMRTVTYKRALDSVQVQYEKQH